MWDSKINVHTSIVSIADLNLFIYIDNNDYLLF